MTAAADMKVAALVPWFGSKRTLAPVIVEEIGPHHTYFEPFCGSMAVLLAKPKVRMECVNDLHGDLINLARVIKDPTLGPALYRRARRTWMVEGEFRDAAARWKARGVQPATDPPDLARASDFLVMGWPQRSRRDAELQPRVRGTLHPGRRSWWHPLAVGGEQHPGMATADAGSHDDPPYLVKGAKYVFDFADADHAKLALALARFKRARVVVSYYAHPLLAELYPRWTVRETPTTKAMVRGNGRGGGAVVAPEVLLLNGPSFMAEAKCMFGT